MGIEYFTIKQLQDALGLSAAYRCIEKQVNICNGCYARLMRGLNQENGIF